MGFGIGLLMTAAGAILIRAVNQSTAVNLHTVGWVLSSSAVATALSLVFWSSWVAGRAAGAVARRGGRGADTTY